jgi:ABC-2 type transport system permease protein
MFKRDAALALSYDWEFWSTWLGLVIQVLSFYFISRLIAPSPKYGFGDQAAGYFQFVAINLAFVRFQSTAVVCFQTAIRDDQLAGTMEAIMATPTSLPIIVLSRGLWAFALTLMQVAIFLLMAVALGLTLTHVNVLSAAIFTLLTIACMSPVGVMAAATIMIFKRGAASSFIMGGLTQLFGGVYFPVSTLPHILQYVSWALPITHALNGIRGAVHGASIVQLAPDAIWLAIAAIVLLPISLWSFARAVQRAKIDGTLGLY